ncbi:MAG: isopropylmalate isomerase [Nitrospinota bacterium]
MSAARGAAIRQIRGRAVPLPGDDIDTDRITPARFLKAITFTGIEKALFCDERENSPDHPIDNPAHRGARLMFVGRNFGSGSSRESAPQAIQRFGVQALVGVSFAEIFAGNSFAIGLPLAATSAENVARLIAQAQKHPRTEFVLDLDELTISFGGESLPVEMQENRRKSFLAGTWDMLANLEANLPRVREVAAGLPYTSGFSSQRPGGPGGGSR